MLRDAIKAGTDVGLKAKSYVESGALVPDEVIVGVILDRLKQADCVQRGWLLDGFPRTAEQATVLKKNGINCDAFILLDVSDSLLLDRVVGRRIDPVTGASYHIKNFPPPNDPVIQARLIQRADDTAEKFSVRIKSYHENLPAILAFFQDKLITVSNTSTDETPTKIYGKINTQLDTRLKLLKPLPLAKSATNPVAVDASASTKASQRKGLTSAEAEALYPVWGYNELPVITIPLWWVFIQQFMGTMPYMLELAIIISAAVQDFADLGIIVAMVSFTYCLTLSLIFIYIALYINSSLLTACLGSLRN